MASKLKVEQSFKNPESCGDRALMFTVLDSKSQCINKECLVLPQILPQSDLPEVDRIYRILLQKP